MGNTTKQDTYAEALELDFILTLDHLNAHGIECVTRLYREKAIRDGLDIQPGDTYEITELSWNARIDSFQTDSRRKRRKRWSRKR